MSLERLDALRSTTSPPQRIGLSATVRPIDEVARFLGGAAPVEIVAPTATKAFDLRVVVPVDDMLNPPPPPGAEPRAATDAPTRTGSPTRRRATGRRPAPPRVHRDDRVGLAARRRGDRRPHPAAPLHDRVLQLAAARRAADRRGSTRSTPSGSGSTSPTPRRSRPRMMAQAGATAGADPGAREGAPRLGVEGAARPGRRRAEVRRPALRRRHEQPRARHRHGRRRPRHPGRGAAVARHPGCSASAAPATRSARSAARRSSPSTAATCCTPRSSPSGCWPGRSRRSRSRRTRSTSSRSRPSPPARSARSTSRAGSRRVKRSAPFRTLPRSAYEATLDLLAGRFPSDEFAELRPRLIWDRDHGTLTGRPGAQRIAVTSGGTIPDRGLFGVFVAGEIAERARRRARRGDGLRVARQRRVHARHDELAHRRDHPRPGERRARVRAAGQGAVLARRRPRPARRARRGARHVLARGLDGDPREGRGAAARRGPRRQRAGQPARLPRASSARRPARSPPTARSRSSAAATRSATGASSCIPRTACRCTRRGRWP